MKALCKFCDAETDGSTYCSLVHKFEHEIMQIKSENLELRQKMDLLNRERTLLDFLNPLAEDQIRDQFKKSVHEMAADEILVFHKKVTVLSEESYLIVKRKDIQASAIKITRDKTIQAVNSQAKQSLPAAFNDSKKQFIVDRVREGYTNEEALQIWGYEQSKNKAIANWMKMGVKKDDAEKMFEASKAALNLPSLPGFVNKREDLPVKTETK